jgi:hypothetical protein
MPKGALYPGGTGKEGTKNAYINEKIFFHSYNVPAVPQENKGKSFKFTATILIKQCLNTRVGILKEAAGSSGGRLNLN